MTEKDLIKNTVSLLSADDFDVYLEMPNMGQSMDVLACRKGYLMAIEVKLFDWRRGLAQCKAHELVCDYICLAIASKDISPKLNSEIRSRGYGLIHYKKVSSECVWVIQPRENQKVWAAQREVFNRRIEERKQCPKITG